MLFFPLIWFGLYSSLGFLCSFSLTANKSKSAVFYLPSHKSKRLKSIILFSEVFFILLSVWTFLIWGLINWHATWPFQGDRISIKLKYRSLYRSPLSPPQPISCSKHKTILLFPPFLCFQKNNVNYTIPSQFSG